jgi:hypothetical protein
MRMDDIRTDGIEQPSLHGQLWTQGHRFSTAFMGVALVLLLLLAVVRGVIPAASADLAATKVYLPLILKPVSGPTSTRTATPSATATASPCQEPANNSRAGACGPLVSGEVYRYTIYSPTDEYDWFYFVLPAAHTIEARLTEIPAGNDYELYLMDGNGTRLQYSANRGNEDEHIVWGPTAAGRYYVVVLPADDGGWNAGVPYALRVTFEDPQPTRTPTGTPTRTSTRTPTLTVNTCTPTATLYPTPTATIGPTPGVEGIHGHVTYSSAPAPGIDLYLRVYGGSSESTVATTTTNADGYYLFSGISSLGPGETYYVRYGPNTIDSRYVAVWYGPDITSYMTGASVAGGDLDIANVSLTSPASGSTLPLPISFTWQRRNATADTYRWILFDPNSPAVAWATGDLGYVGQFTLISLPQGAQYWKAYSWYLAVYNGPDSFGLSYYYWEITISAGSAGPPEGQAAVPWREAWRGGQEMANPRREGP